MDKSTPAEPPQTAVYQQASLNQQSLVLECSVCAEQYGLKFDDQPRSLCCGHTFCTGCLMRIMTTRGVSCPMCNKFHRLPTPDVMLLPVNYAVLDIVKNIAAQDEPPSVPQKPLCGVCNTSPATVICIHCLPNTFFKFCDKCDLDEHMRKFDPVRRHKRFPIGSSLVPGTSTTCSRHAHSAATLYSELLAEFACHLCQQEEDWQARAVHFEDTLKVTEKLKERVKMLTKYSSEMIWKLGESKQNLEAISNDLEPSSLAVKTQVTETFSKCVELLQERQKTLLANVDMELKNRKECLKKQHDAVGSTIARYRNAYQDLNALNSLTSKPDADFILVCCTSIQNVESSLDLEDKSILRPSVSRDIPFLVSNIEKQLSSLGAVGGGLSPTDLEAVPKGPRGTLMQLFWQVPEGCNMLHRFQIEYEQVVDNNIERRGVLVDLLTKEKENEPQYYEVPGNELSAYVDYLCLGYTYRFRIRSANDAGFGLWSDPIIAQSIGFPFTLEYTKKIHRIIIPAFGSYCITVKGAKGADGLMHKGGKGAIISAVVSLKAGDVLILLCGGMSSRHHYHSGGGGGSFVALNEITQASLLIAAGGGGGTRGADAHDFSGSDASVYEDGLDGLGSYFGTGGKNGGPGGDADDGSNSEEPWSWGGGGAGFMQDSTTAQGFVAGGHGGQNGGFGGGGSVGMYGGGGGGGYSGGGGGRGGGGGGSYVISTAVDVTRSVGNEDHGSIFIEKVVPPYPISNSFTRVISTGGSSTASSNSVAQLDTQLSSSSFSTTRATTNSSNGSNTQIGVIPEAEDPPSLHQSPSSTEQVDENPAVDVHFTIEGMDPGPTLVSEICTKAPTFPAGAPPSGNGQTRTSYPDLDQRYSPPSTAMRSAEDYSAISMKPTQSAQNIGDMSVQQQWKPAQSAQNIGDMSVQQWWQHSEADLVNRERLEDVPQRHNRSPPMTQHRALDPAVSSVTVQQPPLPPPQQMQQQQLQFQQQQQYQQQLSSQPVNQVIPQLRTTTSPPTTAVQTALPNSATVGQQQHPLPVYQQ